MCVCVCVYLYSKYMHPQTIDFIKSHVHVISKCSECLLVYIYVKIGIWDRLGCLFSGSLYSLDTGSEGSPPQSRRKQTI